MTIHCSCNIVDDKKLRAAVAQVLSRDPPPPHPLKEAFQNLGVDYAKRTSCKTCMRSVIGELRQLLKVSTAES